MLIVWASVEVSAFSLSHAYECDSPTGILRHIDFLFAGVSLCPASACPAGST